jgi:hypothetical protein
MSSDYNKRGVTLEQREIMRQAMREIPLDYVIQIEREFLCKIAKGMNLSTFETVSLEEARKENAIRTKTGRVMSSDKIDAWVVWHPEHGVIYNSLSHLASKKAAQTFADFYNGGVFEEAPRGPGWRIRPVRLEFLDEDKP